MVFHFPYRKNERGRWKGYFHFLLWLQLNNLNQYLSQSFLRHIFDCLFVSKTGLLCFTHLFYLVILLCLTRPLMFFFCNIDFDFQSLNFIFGAKWFISTLALHLSACLFLPPATDSLWLCKQILQFGPIWVFICCNPQICADNLVTQAWLFLRCASSFWLSSFAYPHALFLSSLLMQGGGGVLVSVNGQLPISSYNRWQLLTICLNQITWNLKALSLFFSYSFFFSHSIVYHLFGFCFTSDSRFGR